MILGGVKSRIEKYGGGVHVLFQIRMLWKKQNV